MMAGDAAFCAVMRDTKNVFVVSLEYMIEAFAIPPHNLRMYPELEGIPLKAIKSSPTSSISARYLAPSPIPNPAVLSAPSRISFPSPNTCAATAMA